jgi:hypothetical protein
MAATGEMSWLNGLADVASIVTASIAAWAYGFYRLTVRRRTRALERVLAKKNQPGDDSLTLQQLGTALTLTDEQVIEAASRSKKVRAVGWPIRGRVSLQNEKDREVAQCQCRVLPGPCGTGIEQYSGPAARVETCRQ